MPRLLFKKTGSAIWISHLDLMRLFQRAFKRAGLPLTHTNGFNPRPSVSIALPLSVGVESQCELLDFELLDCEASNESILEKLNAALVSGVTVLEVYQEARKIRELAFLRCNLVLEYDNGVPCDAVEAIHALFRQSAVVVPKKTKSGIQDQNIVEMIKGITVTQKSDREVEINALVCCQNPTLNPAQISLAVEKYLPAYKPDFTKCSRIEIFDCKKNVFR